MAFDTAAIVRQLKTVLPASRKNAVVLATNEEGVVVTLVWTKKTKKGEWSLEGEFQREWSGEMGLEGRIAYSW